MTFPSAQELASLLDTNDAAQGTRLLSILQAAPSIESAMSAACVALDGYAVDSVAGINGSTLALYVSNGDAFADTLLFDVEEQRFCIASLSEWRYQQRMAMLGLT